MFHNETNVEDKMVLSVRDEFASAQSSGVKEHLKEHLIMGAGFALAAFAVAGDVVAGLLPKAWAEKRPLWLTRIMPPS